MKILLLAMEHFKLYPEQSNGASEVLNGLKNKLSGMDNTDAAGSLVPYVYGESIDEADKQIENEKPDYLFLLTDAPNNLEIVLYRYGQPLTDPNVPDNNDQAPQDISEDYKTIIPKANIMGLHQAWAQDQKSGLTPVTLTLANDGYVDGDLFFKLLERYQDDNIIVTRFGVPPITPQNETLTADVLEKTLYYLITKLLEL